MGLPQIPSATTAPDGSIKVRNLLWNTETLEWEASTMGSGAGQAVSVENFPAVISGSSIPVSDVISDPTKHYKITDLDTSGDPQYFGYLDKDGNWYIMQLTGTAARYKRGSSDYVGNWVNRGILEYGLFHNIF